MDCIRINLILTLQCSGTGLMSYGIYRSKNVTEQSLVLQQQQYEVRTDVRVAIDAFDDEYNHDARTKSRRLSAARQLSVGGSGIGPRDQQEQRTQRASFVTMHHTRVHTQQQQQQQQVVVLGSDAWLKTTTREAPRHVSLRPD